MTITSPFLYSPYLKINFSYKLLIDEIPDSVWFRIFDDIEDRL